MSPFVSMPLNLFAADAWLNQLCYGMRHTANDMPPEEFDGSSYESGVTLGRSYRSLTSFSLELEFDRQGALLMFRQAPGSRLILDPGYTPPFDSKWELTKGKIGVSVFGVPSDAQKMDEEAKRFSPGEYSSLSQFIVPKEWKSTSITPLACSTIKTAANETVLGHSLIKFRAGTPGDYIGVAVMNAPNHVPWVWCETMLTYAGPNKLMLYGAGSGFPSHAFYCLGSRRDKLDLSLDRAELRKIFTSGLTATKTADITMTPGRGADGFPSTPRVSKQYINSQAPTTEDVRAGQSIPDQPYTAPANTNKIRVAVPFG